MTLLGAQRSTVLLMAGAGLGSVVLSDQLQRPFELGLPIAFVASIFLGERLAGRLKLLWQLVLVSLLVYFSVSVVLNTLDIVAASSTFAASLLIYALFNRHSVKDYNLVHLAAMMCVAGGAALSAELAYGGCFVIFVFASTWALTLTQLRNEVEDEARRNKAADDGRSVLLSRHLISARFLAMLAGLALAALIVAAGVFLTFPRLSIGLLHRKATPGMHAGFSNSVDLGASGVVKSDPTVALRITLGGGKHMGESLPYYWRGASFNTYDGHGWHDTVSRPRMLTPWLNGMPTYYFGDRGQEGDEFFIEVAPETMTDAIFTTGSPVSVRFLRGAGTIGPTQPTQLLQDGLGNLVRRSAQSQPTRYVLRAKSEPIENLGALGRDYDGAAAEVMRLRQHHHHNAPEETQADDDPRGPRYGSAEFVQEFTAVPKLDQRVIDLAHKLIDGKDPYSAISNVERYLGGFTYSTDLPVVGDDPLADFLFKTKTGSCEYFATAMTILLRAGGIPSRLVTGFFGGKYVERGDYYVVRQGDAHAWTEVYFPGKGWRTFDGTPALSRAATLENLYGRFELWLDGVRTAWRDMVVDYDLTTQIRGVQRLIEIARSASTRLSSAPRALHLMWAGHLLVEAGVIIALLLGVRLLWQRRRPRPRQIIHRTESQRRARILLRDLVQRLSHHGIARAPGWTPRELASEAHRRNFPHAALVDRVVDRYLSARYGNDSFDRQELDSLRRDLREL